MNEERLAGGNLNQVVRIGNTVRRPLHPWSETIHRLFAHLEQQGFDGSPRFLGVDEKEREILSFIEGEVGFVTYRWHEEVLVATAHLLRAFHDATVDFIPSANAYWQVEYPDPNCHEVICHNDFAPYNLVFVNQRPHALIDFDLAGPGPRLRDVALGAYWFVPLSFRADDMADQALDDVSNCSRRLKLFCDSYGISADRNLLDMVEEVLAFLWRFPEKQVQSGYIEYQRLIDEGHTEHWRQELAAYQAHRVAIEENLCKIFVTHRDRCT